MDHPDMTATEAEAAANEPNPSRLEREQLFKTLQAWVRADMDHWNAWRMRAKEEFAFVAGPGQWQPEEISKLQSEMRPVVTFNKTLKFIRAVCGVEKNNRQSIVFLPNDVVNAQEVVANEMLTAASDWMAEGCKASRHQSRAVRDAAICGVGFTEALVDFDDDPKGKYVETRCDPLEMGWDKDARDDNLQDAKRLWRVRRMPLKDAKELLSGLVDPEQFTDFDFDASWASDFGQDKRALMTEAEKDKREDDAPAPSGDKTVTIVQVQWIEREVYVKFAHPMTGEMMDASQEQFAALQKQIGMPLPSARLKRKVYKQAFIGGDVLHSGPSPVPTAFTFSAITWEPDDTDGSWFGLVRVLRDPQSWSNKFFSQLMHMVNSTAKGGILAEEGAFPDIKQAQKTYARPDAITVVSKGALVKGMIQPKPGTALSAGVMQLLEISDAMFSETTGINLELMGLADREQAGVLEAQRKQAAMTILADLFDSIGSFHETVGRLRLYYIQKHFADGRLIRVYGDQGAKMLPMVRDQLLGSYDVMVEDAPTSTNMKEKAWAGLTMLLPAVQHMLTPKIVMMLLDYVPYLPAKLVQALKSIQSEPDPQAAEQADLAKRGAMAQIAKDEAAAGKSKSGAILDLAKAGAEQAAAQESKLQSMLAMVGLGGARERSKYTPAQAEQQIIGPATGGLPPMVPLGAPRAPMADEAPPMPMPLANGGVRPPGGLQ